MTHEDAVQAAMYRVVDKGLPTTLIDKAGRNWSIEGYTRMVVNITVNRAFNEVRLQRMKDFDMHLALMSSHPNSRPACAPIQGHVVNLVSPSDPDFDPHYDSIFNHGYGEPSGTQGINCRHILFPYEPGVSENHQPQYDPDEAIKNGKLVQQQRARERAIRDAKKRLRVAEQLGDESMVSQTKTLIRTRQAKLRDFIKEINAGKKNPILTRDYSREKIVSSFVKVPSGALDGDGPKARKHAQRFYDGLKNSDRQILIDKISKSSNLDKETVTKALTHILDPEKP